MMAVCHVLLFSFNNRSEIARREYYGMSPRKFLWNKRGSMLNNNGNFLHVFLLRKQRFNIWFEFIVRFVFRKQNWYDLQGVFKKCILVLKKIVNAWFFFISLKVKPYFLPLEILILNYLWNCVGDKTKLYHSVRIGRLVGGYKKESPGKFGGKAIKEITKLGVFNPNS